MKLLRGCVLLTALALLPLALASLGSAQDGKAETVLVGTDGKATVTMPTNGMLTIKLFGNAGTGYSWDVKKNNDKVLESQGKPTVEPADKAANLGLPVGKVGGQTLTVFRFKAISNGTADVELQYRRPFEKNGKPARTYSAKVTVVNP